MKQALNGNFLFLPECPTFFYYEIGNLTNITIYNNVPVEFYTQWSQGVPSPIRVCFFLFRNSPPAARHFKRIELAKDWHIQYRAPHWSFWRHKIPIHKRPGVVTTLLPRNVGCNLITLPRMWMWMPWPTCRLAKPKNRCNRQPNYSWRLDMQD